MESYNLQIMLKDGSFQDYEIRTERDSKKFDIFKDNQPIASFELSPEGKWILINNPANIDSDLQERLSRQLNGF